LSNDVLRNLLYADLLPTGLLSACVLQSHLLHPGLQDRDLLPDGLLSFGALLRDEDGLLPASSFLLPSSLYDSVLLYRACAVLWPGNLNW
jgi:hypothetical protein